MKKIAIICMIIGIVLLLGGVGCRLAVDLNKDVKEVNESLNFFLGEKLSPSLVSKVMNGEMKIFGETITLDDILDMSDDADVTKLKVGLKLYASSTLMIICGGVLTVLSVIAFFILKKKR